VTVPDHPVSLWGGRVLVLAHVKELLEQTADKLTQVCPELRFGIYSAGLGRRDTTHPVIVAGIQSVFRRACELDAFDLVIIDEAHMIPLEGDGMYRQFLADARTVNPGVRVLGLTATPFRMKTGPICVPADEGGILNTVCFEVGVRELIRDGYLCPLVSKAGQAKVDTDVLHVRGGEFVAGEAEELMDREALVLAACNEIIEHTQDRHACLIFATGVQHGRHIVQVLQEKHEVACGFVCGETPTGERDEVLERFRRGALKYLCNVNVLTTGFDAPNIDCVALLRPTLSPGLYYQMVGRGFRLHPGKDNCLVLDFGGNVLRHGPVDQLRMAEDGRSGNGKAPAKECPDCHAVIAAGYTHCPECGYEFAPPERRRHEAKASEAGILSTKITTTRYSVRDVFYSAHRKRGSDDDSPRSLRVDYKVGWNEYKSEWVCIEHDGYPRQKAIAWWQRRSPDPVPDTAHDAVVIANHGGLAVATSITVRCVEGDTFERIIDWELGPVPESISAGEATEFDPSSIPF
jgi:DNA repair protein RadD